MSDERLVTSIAFETTDEEVNAGPWLVTLQAGDGSTVTTGPWVHADAVSFAESMAEVEGVVGQVVVEPLFDRPDLDTAREFLIENAATADDEVLEGEIVDRP